jgi:hypothetical protein
MVSEPEYSSPERSRSHTQKPNLSPDRPVFHTPKKLVSAQKPPAGCFHTQTKTDLSPQRPFSGIPKATSFPPKSGTPEPGKWTPEYSSSSPIQKVSPSPERPSTAHLEQAAKAQNIHTQWEIEESDGEMDVRVIDGDVHGGQAQEQEVQLRTDADTYTDSGPRNARKMRMGSDTYTDIGTASGTYTDIGSASRTYTDIGTASRTYTDIGTASSLQEGPGARPDFGTDIDMGVDSNVQAQAGHHSYSAVRAHAEAQAQAENFDQSIRVEKIKQDSDFDQKSRVETKDSLNCDQQNIAEVANSNFDQKSRVEPIHDSGFDQKSRGGGTPESRICTGIVESSAVYGSDKGDSNPDAQDGQKSERFQDVDTSARLPSDRSKYGIHASAREIEHQSHHNAMHASNDEIELRTKHGMQSSNAEFERTSERSVYVSNDEFERFQDDNTRANAVERLSADVDANERMQTSEESIETPTESFKTSRKRMQTSSERLQTPATATEDRVFVPESESVDVHLQGKQTHLAECMHDIRLEKGTTGESSIRHLNGQTADSTPLNTQNAANFTFVSVHTSETVHVTPSKKGRGRPRMTQNPATAVLRDGQMANVGEDKTGTVGEINTVGVDVFRDSPVLRQGKVAREHAPGATPTR